MEVMKNISVVITANIVKEYLEGGRERGREEGKGWRWGREKD